MNFGQIYRIWREDMERRRIQLTGGSSFMITLPKKWVEANGLKKNDELLILERKDGSLLILPESPRRSNEDVKEIIVSEEVSPDSLFRALVSAFISGEKFIKVSSAKRLSPEHRNVVRLFTLKAVGQEIIEESENHILTKNLLDPSEMSFESIIKRMLILVLGMLEDSSRIMKEGRKELGEEILSRDDEVDRLYWLISREHTIFSRDIALSEAEGELFSSFHFFMVARSLERAGDHAVRVARNLMALPDSIDPENLRLISLAIDFSKRILEESVRAFLSNDVGSANEIIERSDDLFEIYQELQYRALGENPTSAIAISSISESIRRIVEYGKNVCEQTINHVLSSRDSEIF
ncbi:MAG: hypothetical protein PWR13_631 [Archaeoglobi archaeon]|nr:hypothetical protein [Archaeoglobi archaeon]MDK2781603.1 hypothetical protein [Archaeoglobi archaeon]